MTIVQISNIRPEITRDTLGHQQRENCFCIVMSSILFHGKAGSPNMFISGPRMT
jgi:hypothetical protein